MRNPGTLVGRRAELGRLDAFVAGAGAAGRLLVVVGEAGIGKTCLVDELASSAAAAVRVVRGRADEHDPVAFGLWRGPLSQLDLPRPGTDRSVPANEERWEVVDLLASALRTAGPVLVVLDDLHWADDDSLWVFEHLLDRVGGAPVALVAATRPRSEARAARWHNLYRRAEIIALDGLDVPEVAELAERLGAPPSEAERLWRHTGGNPLFVRELVASGADGVSTVRDLLVASIERLGPKTVELVTVVALAGPDTPNEVLAAACAAGADELERSIDEARRADLLRDDAGQVRLRHDLLADAAIARCPPGDQRRLHNAIADAWATRGGPEAVANRARHQLLAVPAVDATAAGEAALEAGGALREQGRHADAAALLRLAGSALDGRPDVPAGLKARLALAEGEARWALDDIEAATAVCDVAVRHAAGAGDPVLVASAEVAALAHHNPLVPDPVRIARLAELDAALPAGHDGVDPRLRIRLRGRQAVLSMSLPDRRAEAVALGDDAVARARALDDPDALVGALGDRLFVLATPGDLAARDEAAEEILALARATGRPALALRGHEWRYAARLGVGDLPGAVAALTELAALASIMPSPYWRWAAALRRCGLLGLLGDFDGATRLADSTRQLAAGVVPEAEAIGLDFALRLSTAALYGRDAHAVGHLHRGMLAASGDAPLLFLQARFALTEALLGHPTAGRRRLAPWCGRFDACLHGPEGLSTLGVLAHTVTLQRWQPEASELRRLLRPFAGRLAIGNGVTIDLPVDHHLAALSLLAGDLDDAVGCAHRAVALTRRMRAPALEARALGLLSQVTERAGDGAAAASAHDAATAIAEAIGMVLPEGADRAPGVDPGGPPNRRAEQADRRAALRFDGGRWSIDSPFGAGHVPDSIGTGQLVRLLTAPGREIAAVELAGAAQGGAIAVDSDLGPALDARAKREYRRRITELRADIDEAEDHNDLERAARHRVELDALLGELSAAVGLGGRDRPQRSGSERARVNTTRNIRRSIAAIAAVLPDLGAHLTVSVRTGHQCSYAPEPAARLRWTVDEPDR
ncbi:MAG TPA: AAA family ATPase [Acidimicrobiales bacterium]